MVDTRQGTPVQCFPILQLKAIFDDVVCTIEQEQSLAEPVYKARSLIGHRDFSRPRRVPFHADFVLDPKAQEH